jgi:hypothetical protein
VKVDLVVVVDLAVVFGAWVVASVAGLGDHIVAVALAVASVADLAVLLAVHFAPGLLFTAVALVQTASSSVAVGMLSAVLLQTTSLLW